MSTFSLHVPAPCAEPWNGMQPGNGGRFCDRCQHTVADLTNATDAELMTLFSGNNAPHCARFDPAQLERALEPKRRRPGLLPIAAFTSLLAVACGTETIAQGTPSRIVGEVAIRPGVTQVDTSMNDSTRAAGMLRTGRPVLLSDTLKRIPRTPERIVIGKPLPVPGRKEEEQTAPDTK